MKVIRTDGGWEDKVKNNSFLIALGFFLFLLTVRGAFGASVSAGAFEATVVDNGAGFDSLSGGNFELEGGIAQTGEASGGVFTLQLYPPPDSSVNGSVIVPVTGGGGGVGLDVLCAQSGGYWVFDENGIGQCMYSTPTNVSTTEELTPGALLNKRVSGLKVGSWIVLAVVGLVLMGVIRGRRRWMLLVGDDGQQRRKKDDEPEDL